VRHEDGDVPAAGFNVVVVVVVELETWFEGPDEGVVTGGVDVWNWFSRPEQSTEPDERTQVCAVPDATCETDARDGTFVGIDVAYDERPI